MIFLKNFVSFLHRHCAAKPKRSMPENGLPRRFAPRNDVKAFVTVFCLCLFFALPARAVCTLPAGDHGDMLYNLDHTVMQYCNGTKWISMDASKSGGSDNLGNHTATKDLDMTAHKIVNAAIPTASADVTNKAYVDAAVASAAGNNQNSTARYQTSCVTYGNTTNYAYCVRTDMQTGATECVYNSGSAAAMTWTPCAAPFSGSGGGGGMDSNGIAQGGYFVMTAQTYNGNLGGLTGANAKCLTELQTHPWKGKGSAGSLTAARVKAFLCDSTSCNNLNPYTRYTFAITRDAGFGGATMTTDMNGAGPNDTASWTNGNYFGPFNYTWWSNRDNTSSAQWATTPIGTISCTNWSSSASGNGYYGNTGDGNYARWKSGQTTCSGTYRLICFVNPATE